MKKVLLILSILYAACNVYTTLPAVETGRKMEKELFSKAQATFNDAQRLEGRQKKLAMLKAAAQFESLVEDFGIDNGYLFYNIGNAYYEAGEKGKAILFYKRAERLIPGFDDLKYNLKKAQNDLQLSGDNETWWTNIVRSILFWHYMMDFNTRRTCFTVAFSAIWIFLVIGIFKRSLLLRLGVYLMIILSLGFGGSFAWSAYRMYAIDSGVVITSDTVVRKGPGKSYQPFYENPVSAGSEFTLLAEQGNWWKIRFSNGDEVWIEKEYADLI